MNGITPRPPLGRLEAPLTVDEAAATLEIPPEEVLRHIRAGDLPHLRVQGQDAIEFRVLPEDVLALSERLMPVAIDTSVPSEGNEGRGPRRDPAEAPPTPSTLSEALSGALVPLLAHQERLQGENARLHETVAAQAARIADLEASAALVHEGARPETGEEQATGSALPEAMAELGAQVRALQEELAFLRERRQVADDGAFQQAWRKMQRRPWWADLLD
ncbi:MAG TPA: helix-turn-helix domain-containing protein [Chloroflexota bacterium]|nr:helix-turn-helix domain-containing protein [Chloroflexota bacterium]